MQALKQCRRPWAMTVSEVVPLAALVEGESGQAAVWSPIWRAAFGDLPKTAGNLLVVGPEGGFTAEENRAFDRRGWPRAAVGPTYPEGRDGRGRGWSDDGCEKSETVNPAPPAPQIHHQVTKDTKVFIWIPKASPC